MKTLQLTLVTLLLFFTQTNSSEAQYQLIDSLKIIPTNPTTNDTVSVISLTAFPNIPCYITSSSINIIGSAINVYASHQNDSSMWPAVCNSIDTLTIGQLNAGSYELYYHLADTAPPTTYDIDTIVFTVQQASGLQLTDNLCQEIKVYPNPASETITIDFLKNTIGQIDLKIFNVFGQLVFTQKIFNNMETTTLDISRLGEGIYFTRMTLDNQTIYDRKIIITR